MLKAEIYIDQDDMIDSVHLDVYIMRLLVSNNIKGATSITGNSGFGKSHHIKNPGGLFSFDQPPIVITFIDTEEKVKEALTEFRKKVSKGFIITNRVDTWN